MNEQTFTQLRILKELSDLLQSQGVTFWLRGGWAIDFHIGKITREHSDLDLVTLTSNRETLEQLLVATGYQLIPIGKFQTDFLKNNVDISLVFVNLTEDGRIIANGFPDWEWQRNALQAEPLRLEGITAHVLSLEQLLEEKLVYEEGTGRKLRAKDLKSIEILRGMIANNHEVQKGD
ncbi:nucleotidyltransferase domain-containing protein [Pseudoneobacillus sp. C159]